MIEISKTDLMSDCPACHGKSGEAMEFACETCDGTGTVLTELGEAIDLVARRRLGLTSKFTWQRHNPDKVTQVT